MKTYEQEKLETVEVNGVIYNKGEEPKVEKPVVKKTTKKVSKKAE